ncbi:MAG TPA: transcriptional regulator [Chitinophagaceae bacterium]|nr:transcriptional regulator [Chitinophagaceae bacterium]
MANAHCNLNDCFLCRHSIPEWRPLIGLNKETKTFKKGKPVFIEGEPVKGIYFVYAGWVKIHKKWTHPRELIVRFAGPGDVIGHRGLGEEKNYPVSATALDDSTICFVPSDFLESSFKANPNLTYRFMQFYAGELQKAEKRMRDLVHMEVKGRIAGALLEISRLFGTNPEGYIALPISRQDIASYAGTTYETIFKTFNEWMEDTIISTSGKYIRLDKPDKLRMEIMYDS